MPSPRLLIVPAAGLGSRLGAKLPKLLVPVAGKPMIDRILDLYRGSVSRVAIVVNPAFARAVRDHLERRRDSLTVDCLEQPEPTGMLDAIMLGVPLVSREQSVWVTWCDQIAVHPRTIERLAAATAADQAAPFVMPVVRRTDPYIHFERDDRGQIVRVLHRREGDPMPAMGESDMGLFAMSSAVFTRSLPEYAREVEVGQATGERNFLPFIPWLARRQPVITFPCEDPMEAVGVNTPQDLKIVEEYLR